jgi:hypothetical protein
MFKGKLAVLGLVAAALLVVNGVAFAGIIDPCASSCTLSLVGANPPLVACLFVCPQGDTNNWIDQNGLPGSGDGFFMTVTVIDNLGFPIPNIPGPDFWVVDCNTAALNLCAGAASTGADAATDATGTTTIGQLGTTTAGGCTDGLRVVVQGNILQENPPTCTDICKTVLVRSPDITGNLLVDLADLSAFALSFPPNPFDTCCDFDCNATVNLGDLSRFAFHFGPPGHVCN